MSSLDFSIFTLSLFSSARDSQLSGTSVARCMVYPYASVSSSSVVPAYLSMRPASFVVDSSSPMLNVSFLVFVFFPVVFVLSVVLVAGLRGSEVDLSR